MNDPMYQSPLKRNKSLLNRSFCDQYNAAE